MWGDTFHEHYFKFCHVKIACIQLLTVNLVVSRKAYMTKYRMEYMSQLQMISQFVFENNNCSGIEASRRKEKTWKRKKSKGIEKNQHYNDRVHLIHKFVEYGRLYALFTVCECMHIIYTSISTCMFV